MAGFNTPGSKVDRNFLAEAELNLAKQTAEATLVSPWVKAAAKGNALLFVLQYLINFMII